VRTHAAAEQGEIESDWGALRIEVIFRLSHGFGMAKLWAGLSLLAEGALETWKDLSGDPIRPEAPAYRLTIDPPPPGKVKEAEPERVQIRITPF
jgi:hypothetical protein